MLEDYCGWRAQQMPKVGESRERTGFVSQRARRSKRVPKFALTFFLMRSRAFTLRSGLRLS